MYSTLVVDYPIGLSVLVDFNTACCNTDAMLIHTVILMITWRGQVTMCPMLMDTL